MERTQESGIAALSFALAPGGYGLLLAFVIWGLREIGARTALIVSQSLTDYGFGFPSEAGKYLR